MTYRPNTDLLIDDGRATRAARAASQRISARFRTWQALDAERRLQAVNRALKAPANDLIDGYPLAL